MTKREVLSIFNRAGVFLTPDEVQRHLRPQPDRRSFYSYLLRLDRQGLLERRSAGRGSLAYRISDRGRKRLLYLQQTR
jgi:DNA-binding PadR family transcriptional regulator